MYADIIIDISHEKLDRTFQYLVPSSMEEKLEEGMCVTVPFGNGNRLIQGYVTALTEECQFDPLRMKAVHSIVTDSVSVEARQIRLAAWIRKHYGSTMIQALKTVLPAKRTVKKLEYKTILATADKETLIAALGEAMRKKQSAKVRLLEHLVENESIPYTLVTGKLGVSGASVNALVHAGLVQVVTDSKYRNPVKLDGEEQSRKQLSGPQQSIVDGILQAYDEGHPENSLIHGITGSGKTEVYMELVEQMVKRGKQAIVLIPEIALTYQTLLRFYRRFGDRVSVLNSTLSPGEKYDQCERARRGEIDVIIGPRSALFTPFPQIGVIIMDEEHENSYKSESSPKYHARETAEEIAGMHGAVLVLGSATPSLEAYYRAEQGTYRLYTLKERLTGGSLPTVHTVDLRQELMEGNRSIFSRKLQELLQDRLEKGEQSMLFLNRRGYAGFLSCRSCGLVMNCPHCDVSLSEHRDGRLHCHYCGYVQPRPPLCPKCGSRYLLGFKAGTQQIEEKLAELYPQAKVLRMDADTTKTKDSYEKILTAFANKEADILIGTQMIVKGHDFPEVTLVGILAADLSLAAADYRSGERTFQLLTQAAGRAGRGKRAGEVVIQTYQPEHYAVVHAQAQDYESFYREELLYRKMLGYPPVAHMLAVQIFGGEEKGCMELAERLSKMAEKFADPREPLSGRLQVLGPAPASIGKINDIFRFVFYVKYGKYDTLVHIKDVLEEMLTQYQGKETVQFDFDPMNPM